MCKRECYFASIWKWKDISGCTGIKIAGQGNIGMYTNIYNKNWRMPKYIYSLISEGKVPDHF